MLTFERGTSSFILDGVRIGPDTAPDQLAAALGVGVEYKPGDPSWCFVKTGGRPVDAFVMFLEGALHSGYFWVKVPGAGWDDYERAEQQRRHEHERLMHQMFGSLLYRNAFLNVDLVRDPRSVLEQICFEMQ